MRPIRTVLVCVTSTVVALVVARASNASPAAGPMSPRVSSEAPSGGPMAPDCVDANALGPRHAGQLRSLPADARAAIANRFPKGSVVASCQGTFAGPGATAVTILEPHPADKRLLLRRAIIEADGTVTMLGWSEGPSWNYGAGFTAGCTEGGTFIGHLECVAPKDLDALFSRYHLQKGFGDRGVTVDPRKVPSVCFSFDATYNGWQCFAYDAASKEYLRWGWQTPQDRAGPASGTVTRGR